MNEIKKNRCTHLNINIKYTTSAYTNQQIYARGWYLLLKYATGVGVLLLRSFTFLYVETAADFSTPMGLQMGKNGENRLLLKIIVTL